MASRRETLQEKIKALFAGRSSPSEIALGIALGVFIGVLPIYGFHLILWLIFAFLVPRANKFAIFLGTNISLPWTIPLITWASYELGRIIMAARAYPPLDAQYFRNFEFRQIGSFYYPLFIGSLILGVICAAVFYCIAYTIVSVRQKNRGGNHES